ncbi:hypothetical protein AXF42_Ash013897 [Apostasia shenzhenica]|uniref:Uncharacterized protein n=1 Tax=Apostasia shenzhenica TaxID=1088818 RepID=A0A2I0AS62_9ASPA|nr:hypothetical protein AXF42_Ash013897 [Apostasia shenzhenica]
MAITHDDLSIRNYRTADISSRLAFFLVGLSVLCGLGGFILCLAGEAARSEVTWTILTIQDSGTGYRCYYSVSGKTPLAFALAAFLLFAAAMFTEHAYMLVAITSPSPPAIVWWPARNDPGEASPTARALTWRACFLFLAAWICFAVAEVLLMIAIGVESGHLHNWTKPMLTCPAVRPGILAAAGVFGLATVFLGLALHLTALRTQRLYLQDESMPRRQHVRPTAPPQEASSAVRAQHSQVVPRDTSFLNKTSSSA